VTGVYVCKGNQKKGEKREERREKRGYQQQQREKRTCLDDSEVQKQLPVISEKGSENNCFVLKTKHLRREKEKNMVYVLPFALKRQLHPHRELQHLLFIPCRMLYTKKKK
jgi:hypothetical protein